MRNFIKKIREDCIYLWGRYTVVEKVLLVFTPAIPLIALALFLNNQPRMVTLVKGDEMQLAMISDFLTRNNIAYQVSEGGAAILVDEDIKNQARFQLARANLLGATVQAINESK